MSNDIEVIEADQEESQADNEFLDVFRQIAACCSDRVQRRTGQRVKVDFDALKRVAQTCVWTVENRWSNDLDLYTKHGKRQCPSADDARLIFHRDPRIEERVTRVANSLASRGVAPPAVRSSPVARRGPAARPIPPDNVLTEERVRPVPAPPDEDDAMRRVRADLRRSIVGMAPDPHFEGLQRRILTRVGELERAKHPPKLERIVIGTPEMENIRRMTEISSDFEKTKTNSFDVLINKGIAKMAKMQKKIKERTPLPAQSAHRFHPALPGTPNLPNQDDDSIQIIEPCQPGPSALNRQEPTLSIRQKPTKQCLPDRNTEACETNQAVQSPLNVNEPAALKPTSDDKSDVIVDVENCKTPKMVPKTPLFNNMASLIAKMQKPQGNTAEVEESSDRKEPEETDDLFEDEVDTSIGTERTEGTHREAEKVEQRNDREPEESAEEIQHVDERVKKPQEGSEKSRREPENKINGMGENESIRSHTPNSLDDDLFLDDIDIDLLEPLNADADLADHERKTDGVVEEPNPRMSSQTKKCAGALDTKTVQPAKPNVLVVPVVKTALPSESTEGTNVTQRRKRPPGPVLIPAIPPKRQPGQPAHGVYRVSSQASSRASHTSNEPKLADHKENRLSQISEDSLFDHLDNLEVVMQMNKSPVTPNFVQKTLTHQNQTSQVKKPTEICTNVTDSFYDNDLDDVDIFELNQTSKPNANVQLQQHPVDRPATNHPKAVNLVASKQVANKRPQLRAQKLDCMDSSLHLNAAVNKENHEKCGQKNYSVPPRKPPTLSSPLVNPAHRSTSTDCRPQQTKYHQQHLHTPSTSTAYNTRAPANQPRIAGQHLNQGGAVAARPTTASTSRPMAARSSSTASVRTGASSVVPPSGAVGEKRTTAPSGTDHGIAGTAHGSTTPGMSRASGSATHPTNGTGRPAATVWPTTTSRQVTNPEPTTTSGSETNHNMPPPTASGHVSNERVPTTTTSGPAKNRVWPPTTSRTGPVPTQSAGPDATRPTTQAAQFPPTPEWFNPRSMSTPIQPEKTKPQTIIMRKRRP